jgi:DNA-binding beta-propeller fold protein YncE
MSLSLTPNRARWPAAATLLVMSSAMFGTAAPAQVAPESVEVAFVANAEGASVTLVDVTARSIIGTIDVNPARVNSAGPGAPNYAQDSDLSPDGRTLYVSRGYVGDVAAFDVATGRLLWSRPLNTMRADHMTLTRDGRELFVSALVDNRVYRIATATGEIRGHLASGVFPHDIKVSDDGRRLFNTSLGPIASFPVPAGTPPLPKTSGVPIQLTIADAGTLEVHERHPLETAIRPWQFNRDETGLYAQLSNQHAVVFYDLAARKITRRLDLPIKAGVTVTDWDFDAPHHGLALADDGTTLCLAGRASDYAALVVAPGLTLAGTVPVGDAPGWAEIADAGRVCLVANTRSDDLSFVSIRARSELLRLPIGNGPKHITVAHVPPSVIAAVKTRSK